MSDRKIAFFFVPEGGHKPGMGEFLGNFGKNPFEKAGNILGINLEEICIKNPLGKLNIAQYTYAAIYAQSMATHDLLIEHGIRPDVIAGYSLGEYAALCAAGVYGYEKGLNFLYKCSERYYNYFKEGKYGMALATGIGIKELKNACRKVREEGNEVYISNYNAPGFYLISGEKTAFSKVKKELGGKGIRPARVSLPSHCPLVKPVEKNISSEILALMAEVKKPDTKLISTVTAEFADNIETIKNNLKVHLSSPVQWEKTVYAMLLFGINTFIEVGPTGGLYKTILGLSKAFNKDVEIYTTTDSEGLEKVLQIQKPMSEKTVHSSAYAI